MRKSSTGRSSAANLVRMSVYDREDKSAGRSEARRTLLTKSKGQMPVDNSQIPRPRIRSSSSERNSIRRSNLKTIAKTPLSQPRISVTTPKTPGGSSYRLHTEPSSGTRHRSPSAERASGFSAKGPRKDTRPLNDKAYQAAMLNKIDQYFAGIHQSSVLNPNGSLRPITLKIFIEATSCLLRILDIKHDLNINNYMEELLKIAKKLHYPGVVTKSWLKTANTMHSWPHVLAWLSWLVELCDARDLAACTFEIEKLPFVDANGEGEKHRKTFQAMLKSYVAWNDERLDDEAALIEELLQELIGQRGNIDDNIAEANLLLEKAKSGYEVINRQSEEIDQSINEHRLISDGVKSEDAKEIQFIQFTEDAIQRVIQEINQLNLESQTLEEKIQKSSAEHNELNILVEKQSMTVKERDAIIQQCSEIQNSVHQFDNHIKDIEKELYTLDIKFAASNQNLYKAILAYNKDIITYLGCGTGADLEDLKMPETNMLSAYFMETLQTKENAISNIKEQIKARLTQTESHIESNTSELETLKEKLKSLRERNKTYEEKMTEKKISVQQMQSRAKETELKLKEQIKNVESDITKLQRSMPDLEFVFSELSEGKDKYEAVVRRQKFAEKSAERFFNKFYQILSENRNKIASLLQSDQTLES